MNKRVNFLFASVVLCLVSCLSFALAQDKQPLDTAAGFRRVRHKAFTLGLCRMYVGEK